jgi:hypothetical protein
MVYRADREGFYCSFYFDFFPSLENTRKSGSFRNPGGPKKSFALLHLRNTVITYILRADLCEYTIRFRENCFVLFFYERGWLPPRHRSLELTIVIIIKTPTPKQSILRVVFSESGISFSGHIYHVFHCVELSAGG